MMRKMVLILLLVIGVAGICSLVDGKVAAAPKAAAPTKPAPAKISEAPAQEGPKEQKQAAGKPIIGEQAEQLLRQMSDYLKAAKQFSFHAEIMYDDLLPSGQKLQIGALQNVLVRRPDAVFSEYLGETGGRRFWYDGKTITLYDTVLNVHATEQAPPTLDEMLEYLIKVLGFSPPLSDIVYADPYAILTQNVQYGFYAGTSQVNGERCHHLAFQEKNIDWQIWIADGTQCLPRKLVITYKTMPGAPQFIALLSDWDFAVPAPDGMFKANLPPGIDRISFKASVAAEKQQKGGKP